MAGFSPWVIDAFANFEDPIKRWQGASDLVGSSLRSQVGTHVRLLDGPLMGPAALDPTPWSAVAITGAMVVLAIVGAGLIPEVRVAAASAALLMLPYLFYVGVSAPRFLLPALGLLAVAAGAGGVGIARWSSPAGVACLLGVLMAAVASGGVADRIEAAQVVPRAESLVVGLIVESLVGPKNCDVFSQYAIPQVTLSSGCQTHRIDRDSLPCQIGRLVALGEITGPLAVARFGTQPGGIADASIGEAVEGPAAWRVIEIDPSGVACDDPDFVG